MNEERTASIEIEYLEETNTMDGLDPKYAASQAQEDLADLQGAIRDAKMAVVALGRLGTNSDSVTVQSVCGLAGEPIIDAIDELEKLEVDLSKASPYPAATTP